MTTVIYNRQSLGTNAGILSPINVHIESEASREEISKFLVALAAHLVTSNAETTLGPRGYSQWETVAYARNRDGDEFACTDELGFGRSYMGARTDHNHIF